MNPTIHELSYDYYRIGTSWRIKFPQHGLQVSIPKREMNINRKKVTKARRLRKQNKNPRG